MVSGVSPALTRIGFRRDVRLFLGSLIGFLVVMILVLLVLLQTFTREAESNVHAHWRDVADLAAVEVTNAKGGLINAVSQLQARNDIAGLTISGRGGTFHSGVTPGADGTEELTRSTPLGQLHIVFDATSLQSMQRTYRLTGAVCLGGAAAGLMLLFFYLPRITKPIEALLAEAEQFETRNAGADEQQYLIETFRKSIDTLRAQESELQRLHAFEKQRADELEIVTATLTRSLGSGFISLDTDGRVVDVNAAGREILGIGDDEVRGRTVAELLDESMASTLHRAFTDRVALSRTEIVRGAQTIGLTTVPLANAAGEFLGMLALFTDLTGIRDMEQRLRALQSLADVGEISAGIAHEFRNSLSTILGQLRLARLATNPADAQRAVQRAEEEASGLAAAVSALLVFARPLSLSMQELDLLELAREVVARVDVPPSVEIRCDGEPAVVKADAALLGRAIENLVRNAVAAVDAKDGGHVEVNVAASPRPRLTVRDDGVGLDPRDVPRLFLPFQSDRPGGYGIGLALARKIVLLHGGSIALTGEPAGGAEATIEFT